MAENRRAFDDTAEGETANQLALLIESMYPEHLADPSFSSFLQDLEEQFAEEVKERTGEEILPAIAFYNHTITDERTASLMRLMARKQRNVLLAEIDRRYPV